MRQENILCGYLAETRDGDVSTAFDADVAAAGVTMQCGRRRDVTKPGALCDELKSLTTPARSLSPLAAASSVASTCRHDNHLTSPP